MQHRQASRVLARAAGLAVLLAARTLASAQLCTEGPPTELGVVVPLAMPCPQGPGPLPDTTCSGTVVFDTGGGGTGFYAGAPDG